MPATATVKDSDVLVHGAKESHAGGPALAVEKFILHRWPEVIHHCVVESLTDRVEGRDESGTAHFLGKSAASEPDSVIGVLDESMRTVR